MAAAVRFVAAAVAAMLLVVACGAADEPGGADTTTSTVASETTGDAGSDRVESPDGSPAPTSAPANASPKATGPVAESGGEDFPVAAAVWAACGGGLECATVEVPLDHDDPDGARIDLALLRVPASEQPKGSILVNPGGPGGSGVNSIRNGFRLDEATMADHHLVGFDPRGIGSSTALRCTIDLTDGPRPDLSPDDEREAELLDRQARALAEQCGRLDGTLLPHLGTDSVIRDLDLLRQAVGDDRLHYFGSSYGTLIGLRYAERYPTLVGRLVLDGVVDPSFSLSDLLRQQAAEFERAFLVLDDACNTTLECPRGGLVAAYDRLRQELEPAPDGTVGTTELEVATLIAMYSERLWPRYAAALIAAEEGDPSGIELLHDLYVGGINFATYLAVSCIDSRSPVGPAGWDALAAELSSIAPRFGATLANELRSCAFWPAAPVGRPGPVAGPDGTPILVLSTTGDAATPLVNAANVAATLSSAALVTVNDNGHTAYGANFCVEQIVAHYFDTGELPDGIHRC